METRISTEEILSMLVVLTTFPDEESARRQDEAKNTDSSMHFEAVLTMNTNIVQLTLQSLERYATVSKIYNQALELNEVFGSKQQFVSCCLSLLVCLKDMLLEESLLKTETLPKSDKDEGKSPREVPPLGLDYQPSLASVAHEKLLKTTLDFITRLGLCPHYLPGVGIPLHSRSEYAGVVLSNKEETPESTKNFLLHRSIKMVLELMEHSILKIVLTGSYFGDVLAVLIQVAYSPHSHSIMKQESVSVKTTKNTLATEKSMSPNSQSVKNVDVSSSPSLEKKNNFCLSAEDIKFCRITLMTLVQKSYQPLVIKELLILQGGQPVKANTASAAASSKALVKQVPPKWVRAICTRLLSKCLTEPNGVIHVIKAIVDDHAGFTDWKKCAAVGHLIAKPPKSIPDIEVYYKKVTPQLISFLTLKDKAQKKLYFKVICATIQSMIDADVYATKGTVFYNGILKNLLPCIRLTHACMPNYSDLKPGHIVVSEHDLSSCVEMLHEVFTIGLKADENVLTCIGNAIHILFKLICSCNGRVSYLRTLCKDILILYLKTSIPSEASEYLWRLAFECNSLYSRIEFRGGDSGGMVCVVPENREENMPDEHDLTVRVVVELLQEISKEKMVGDFFILVLKELCVVMCDHDATEETNSESLPDNSEDLLYMEQRLNNMEITVFRNLKVLHLVAAMCDTIGPDCLTDTNQILKFIKVTLERGVHIFKDGQENQRDVNMFDKETLSMALGLLTLIISERGELSSENETTLNGMVALLNKVSKCRASNVIKSMADNLKIAIATRFAVSMQRLNELDQQMPKDDGLVDNERENAQNDTENPKPEGGAEGKDTNDKPTAKLQRADTNDTEFEKMLESLEDPMVYMKGHALMALKKLAERGNNLVVEHSDHLIGVLKQAIEHEDSYVYLAAIVTMAEFGGRFPDKVLPILLEQYRNARPNDGDEALVIRTKVGEALVKATKNLGELTAKYKDPLISAFLSTTKDEDSLMRASSLSNLGELCKNLGFAVRSHIYEILNCCSSILKTDKIEQPRRSAAMLITLLLQGLGHNVMVTLDEAMKELYRLLIHVRDTDVDGIVQLHVQLSLEQLSTVLKDLLFPKQTLEKKIFVLDAPK